MGQRERQGGAEGVVEWGCWSYGVGRQEQQSRAVGAAGWGGESDRVGRLERRGGAARAAVGRRTYQESDTEGGVEGESRAEGRAVSQPKSACPAENVGRGME
jgi:hypothetical protein